MKKLLFFCITTILLLLCQTSCIREDDFSNLNDVQYELEPTWGLPLLTGELSMENLLEANVHGIPISLSLSPDGYYIVAYSDTMNFKPNLEKRELSTKELIFSFPVKDTIDIQLFKNEDYGNIQLKIANLHLSARSNKELNILFHDIKATFISKNGNTDAFQLDDVNMKVTNSYQEVLTKNVAENISRDKPTAIALSYIVDIDTSALKDSKDVSLDIASNIELGLYGSASNLDFRDTLDFAANTDSVANYLKQAKLNYMFMNGFPFSLDVQLYFVDQNYSILDSLFVNGVRLESSPVGANDESIGFTQTNGNVTYSGDHIANLNNMKYVVLRASFSTKDTPNRSVKINDKNRLKVQLSAEAQAIIKN